MLLSSLVLTQLSPKHAYAAAGDGYWHTSGSQILDRRKSGDRSDGGPWFIKVGNNLYLNGHNDFISGIQPGHMFSPYYDDTWYALYDKAQHS